MTLLRPEGGGGGKIGAEGDDALRLGLVLCGEGACAACGVGVLKELWRRGLEPVAVCGMLAGAWPAALFCAGFDAEQMTQATVQTQRAGKRLLLEGWLGRRRLLGGAQALCGGGAIRQLLLAQVGERMLVLSRRDGLFLCRTAKSGRRVIFASQAYVQEPGAALVTQVSTGFAARAAMAAPPFLQPMTWLGSPLLAETDTAFACRQLMAMGVQRVLVVMPQPSPQRDMDALDLASARWHWQEAESLPENTALLRVPMPAEVGALSLGRLLPCVEAGEQAAAAELDRALEALGMARCRVLPFRRSV